MVADSLNYSRYAAVANGETLARQPVDEYLAGRRAVEQGVSSDYIFMRFQRRFGRSLHDDPPAGKTLAKIIVAVAYQPERYPRR